MANAKQVAKNNAPINSFASLKDLAYKQAGVSDTLEGMARYALSKIKGFPEKCDDESRDQLNQGYRLRYQENNPAVEYAVVNGHYIPMAKYEGEKPLEKITLTVDYVYSYSQQQFGRLKAENNQLHGLIKDLRDKISTYCSNRFAELKARAKKITAPPRERSATHDFNESLKTALDNLRVRCANAAKRGDTTANKERFSRAMVAFMTAWNKE